MAKIPFGRMMLFFLITAILFGLFGILFNLLNPFFEFYKSIAVYSLMASTVSFVLWLIGTLLRLDSLFEPGQSVGGIADWLDGLFCDIPYFRIAFLSLVISLALFWIHRLVFSVGFTVFIVSLDMFIARLLFFTYGSSANR